MAARNSALSHSKVVRWDCSAKTQSLVGGSTSICQNRQAKPELEAIEVK
jgi:hypothetical protein